jgi:hypothetical protein
LSEHITANQSGQGSGTSGGTVPLTVNYWNTIDFIIWLGWKEKFFCFYSYLNYELVLLIKISLIEEIKIIYI